MSLSTLRERAMTGMSEAEVTRRRDGLTAYRLAREIWAQDGRKRQTLRWSMDGNSWSGSLGECMRYADLVGRGGPRYHVIVDLETGLAFMYRPADGGLWDLGDLTRPGRSATVVG